MQGRRLGKHPVRPVLVVVFPPLACHTAGESGAVVTALNSLSLVKNTDLQN